MPRTTPELVATVIDVDEGDSLVGFIDTANMLVTDVCGGSDYSPSKFELIERWLSAHFYDINRPRASREQASVVRQEMELVKVDLGLNNTKYGQQAMRIDTDGSLAALENRQKEILGGANSTAVECVWVGTDREAY